jgi:hypothetical protein
VFLLDRVYVGAGVDQHLHNGNGSVLDRQHQRGLTIVIWPLRSRARIEKRFHHPGVGHVNSLGERSGSELIGNIGFRLPCDQRIEQLIVDFIDCPVDWARAVRLRLVYIRARSNPLEGRLTVPLLNESGQRTLTSLPRNQ